MYQKFGAHLRTTTHLKSPRCMDDIVPCGDHPATPEVRASNSRYDRARSTALFNPSAGSHPPQRIGGRRGREEPTGPVSPFTRNLNIHSMIIRVFRVSWGGVQGSGGAN